MTHLLPFKSLGCHARILFVTMATVISGCAATKFGYIPEDVKPSNENTMTPTYSEVKEWAYAVADGYDTRATLNRYAIYGGALIGAAAAGAIAGLAAFDSGSSALVGIPIGATFLGSVAAIYSNEEKAHIYRLGAQYIKDLITLSDERLYQCQVSKGRTSTLLQDAEKAEDDAVMRLTAAQNHSTLLIERARKAHEDVGHLPPGPNKELEAAIARDVEDRTSKAATALTDAQGNMRLAKEDVQDAEQCSHSMLTEAQLQDKEALCLRKDLNDVMRKVEAHKARLDPEDIVKRFKDVRPPTGKPEDGSSSSSGSASNDGKTGNSSSPPEDLTDLIPPVKSSCGKY